MGNDKEAARLALIGQALAYIEGRRESPERSSQCRAGGLCIYIHFCGNAPSISGGAPATGVEYKLSLIIYSGAWEKVSIPSYFFEHLFVDRK